MKIQMPQGIHMRHLVAAHLAGFQTGLGSLDARCPFSAGYRPANPAVAFHVTDNGGIGRHAAVLRIGYNNDPDVVGVKLIAPTLVRSVLRFQQASQVGLYGSLLAGIRADLAAQHSDRILLLGERSVQVSCKTDVVVKGRMKRSKSIVLSSAPGFRTDPSNDNGSVCSSTGVAICPLAHLQNELRGTSSSHHCRHRSNVCRLTPTM